MRFVDLLVASKCFQMYQYSYINVSFENYIVYWTVFLKVHRWCCSWKGRYTFVCSYLQEKMRSMLSQVRQDLDIKDESESPDYSPLDTTSSLGSRLHTKYSRGQTGEQTFGSTIDSQNTYNFKDTSSGDMFSTIHSENDELSATQALKSYQLDLTRHVENEEGEESPGEIIQSEDEFGKTDHGLNAENKSVKSSMSAKSSKSAHSSAHFPDERSIKSGKSLGHQSVKSSNHTADNYSVQSGKSQSSQKSGGFKPRARPRALTQNEDISG